MKGIRIGLVAAAFAGLFLATLLIAYFGLDEVGDAFLAVGGSGVLAIAVIHALPIALCGFAWAALLPGRFPAAAMLCTWARWVRESVGGLLGILPVAGEIVGVRILSLHGVRGITAGAPIAVRISASSRSSRSSPAGKRGPSRRTIRSRVARSSGDDRTTASS